MDGESYIEERIGLQLSSITEDKPADGQCTTWNKELAVLLRQVGVSAAEYGSSKYELRHADGGITMGHAITIAEIEGKWFAVDLSSAQVPGLPDRLILFADTLEELCGQVNEFFPNFMSYHPGDEEEFHRAATYSKDKDFALNRGKK